MLQDFSKQFKCVLNRGNSVSVHNHAGDEFKVTVSEIEFHTEKAPVPQNPKVYERAPGPLHDAILTSEHYKVTGTQPDYSSKAKKYFTMNKGENQVFFKNEKQKPYIWFEINVIFNKRGELNHGLKAGVLTCNVNIDSYQPGDRLPLVATK